MERENVVVVLHRPSSAENIGAAARALKNFGFARLSIVAPPSWGGPGRTRPERRAGDDVLARARKVARHASDLLAAAEVHPDARAALGAVTWCCGTTSRTLPGRPRLSPRELAAEVAGRSTAGPVAILFGEERRGLSDAELDLCQAVCTIPTASAYDSMNLAQAVAVVAYELSLAATSAPTEGPRAPPALHATQEALWARLTALLGRVGYLNPQNPEHILSEWRRLLARAEPTQREVELLIAAARALERVVPREE